MCLFKLYIFRSPGFCAVVHDLSYTELSDSHDGLFYREFISWFTPKQGKVILQQKTLTENKLLTFSHCWCVLILRELQACERPRAHFVPGRSHQCTAWLVNIQTKAFSRNLKRDTNYHCEQTLWDSVMKIKVLQMQPSDVTYDIIWRSYVSVQVAHNVCVLRSYGVRFYWCNFHSELHLFRCKREPISGSKYPMHVFFNYEILFTGPQICCLCLWVSVHERGDCRAVKMSPKHYKETKFWW